jgi:hypothetical protein
MDFDVRRHGEKTPKTGANNGVVIDDQDSHPTAPWCARAFPHNGVDASRARPERWRRLKRLDERASDALLPQGMHPSTP